MSECIHDWELLRLDDWESGKPMVLFYCRKCLQVQSKRFSLEAKMRNADHEAKKMGRITAAEVGVYVGEHAKQMLDGLDLERLYLIDPYADYADHTYDGKQDIPEHLATARRVLADYERRIEWIRKPSVEAAKELDNLDYVYIDANHDYERVLEDLSAWYLTIKKGGLLAGHDWDDKQVSRAVTHFAKEGLEIKTGGPDWWIWKK